MNFLKQNKMTIEQLNKIIKEELNAFLKEEEGGDEIEVTTDEPAEGDEAMDLLRQIYDMIKPEIEGEEEPEMDMDMDMEEPEGEEEEEEEEEGEEEKLDEGLSGGEGEMLGWMIEMAEKYGLTVSEFSNALTVAGIATVIAIAAASTFGGPALAKAKQMWKNSLEKVQKGASTSPGTETQPTNEAEKDGKLDTESASKAIRDLINKTPGGSKMVKQMMDVTDIPALDQLLTPGVQGQKQPTKESNSLNESFDMAARFKKLANIRG